MLTTVNSSPHDEKDPVPSIDPFVSKTLQKLVQDEIRGGHWEWQVGSPFNFLSPYAYKALGFSLEDMDFIGWKDLIDSADIAAVEELYKSMFETRDLDSFRIELRFPDRYNIVHWILVKAVVIQRNEEGDPLHIVGINIDITDSKWLQLYSARQAKLAQISLAVNQPFELQQLLLQIATVTEKYLPTTGGASIVLWNQRTCQYAVSASTVPDQGLTTTKERVRTEKGATRWIIDNKRPIIMSDIAEDPFVANPMLPEYHLNAYAGIPLLYEGEVLGVLYALDKQVHHYSQADIDFLTELASRAALAIIKVRMYEELRESYQELQSFAQSISHDLRAPLRTIDGFITILQEDFQDIINEQVQSHMQRICSATKRMDDLICDIMSLSKVTHHEINLREVNLSVIALSILSDLAATNPKQNKKFEIAKDLIVKGDAKLLTILMQNLLSNAWKFSSHKDVSRISVGKSLINELSYIYVKDNGEGFDMSQEVNLFKEFHRLSNSVGFEGNGIGLSIVKRVISRHNGEIFAKSTPSEGTTFYFRI